MSSFIHFRMVFDHEHDRQVREPEQFTDAAAATKAYAEVEAEFAAEVDHVEVVLLASDSLETVQHTHLVFFSGDLPFADRLRDLLDAAG